MLLKRVDSFIIHPAGPRKVIKKPSEQDDDHQKSNYSFEALNIATRVCVQVD